MEFFLYFVLLVILINTAGFFLGYYFQSDKFTDLCYNLSFLLGALMMYFMSEKNSFHLVLLIIVCMWAFRLGSYLFIRVLKAGKDERFDSFRSSFTGFMKFWILQAVSILLVFLPVYIGFSSDDGNIGIVSWIGLLMWFTGFLIETIADFQKFNFIKDPSNRNVYYKDGLFSFIRHPNYLGEIMVWWGIWLYVLPFFSGWSWISIISPIWISVLLLFISGIPLLEEQAEKRYGHLPEYQKHTMKTKRLIPGIY
jgi:steroid 5-alpha reductase family enzyme